MRLETAYTITSKKSEHIWKFSYDLKGNLISFEVVSGMFTPTLTDYLFFKGNFPYSESTIKRWIQNEKKVFSIEINPPEFTFETFWKLYPKGTTKQKSLEFWKKMKECDQIDSILKIKKYTNYCRLTGFQKPVDPIRYLRDRRYEDDFKTT